MTQLRIKRKRLLEDQTMFPGQTPPGSINQKQQLQQAGFNIPSQWNQEEAMTGLPVFPFVLGNNQSPAFTASPVNLPQQQQQLCFLPLMMSNHPNVPWMYTNSQENVIQAGNLVNAQQDMRTAPAHVTTSTRNYQSDSNTKLALILFGMATDQTVAAAENVVLGMGLTLYGVPAMDAQVLSMFGHNGSPIQLCKAIEDNSRLRKRMFDVEVQTAMFSSVVKPTVSNGKSNNFGGKLVEVPYER